MAICAFCNQEMTDDNVTSCSGNGAVEFPNGESLPSITGGLVKPGGRCHDCNVRYDGFHHPGCAVERCPKCGGQLVERDPKCDEQLTSCGCLDEEGRVY